MEIEMYSLRETAMAEVSRSDESTCEMQKIPSRFTKMDEESMQVDGLGSNQKEFSDGCSEETPAQEIANASDLQQDCVFDIVPFEARQPDSVDCSATCDEQFYIAIDASTVAAIKGGTHYTLVSVDGDKLKIAAGTESTEGSSDPSKNSTACTFDGNKPVCVQLPISSITESGTHMTVASNSAKEDFEDLMRTPESHTETKGTEMEQCGSDSSGIYNQYTGTTLATAVPSTTVKGCSSGKEKDYSFSQCAVQVTEFQNVGEELKDLTYTPLTTKNTRMKQEHTLQNCVHFETPRGIYNQQVIHPPSSALPLNMMTPHPAHRSRGLYTATSSPGIPTPYPYKVVTTTHARGQHVHQGWAPYNAQGNVPSTQMIYTAPAGVVSPTSVSSSSSVTPSNLGVSLNSSGEEVNQDSSPDYPRVPFNTPNSGEVDMGGVQRVAIVPEGQQLAQYTGHMENMRYYVPFTGREDHNQKERERRSRIKNACQKLRALVPGLNEKTDKATVFEYSARYLKHLKMHVGTKFDKVPIFCHGCCQARLKKDTDTIVIKIL